MENEQAGSPPVAVSKAYDFVLWLLLKVESAKAAIAPHHTGQQLAIWQSRSRSVLREFLQRFQRLANRRR